MNLIDKSKDYTMTEEYAISYLQTRRLIGIFGMALPFVLIIGSYLPCGLGSLLGSISQYYGSYMRDIFVGVLCAVALFLFSYKGFNKVDNIAATCAAIFALGVAFFPITSKYKWVQYVHHGSSALLLLTLALISLIVFTRSDEKTPLEKRKKIRNTIYRVCGWVMLASVAIVCLYHLLLAGKFTWLEAIKPVFVFEAIALFAFGTSWLIKGRTLWKDIEV